MILIASTDDFSDELGFIVKGTHIDDNTMADRTGRLVAHDILEHQNGLHNIGKVWDELEALGAVWQVRGRHGCLKHGVNDLGADLASCFSYWSAEDYDLGPPTPASRSHLYDEDFLDSFEAGVREMEYHDPERIAAFRPFALHRMRRGFRKAERRHGPSFKGYENFTAIQEAVAKAVKWIDYEGQEFVLNYGNGKATIRERHNPWY